MDALKSECWFSCELATPTSTHVRTQALEAYVTHGRATTSAVELSDGHPAVSVSFKDASQGDVKNLPCGARSLLIEADTGAIVCRGINKFFDMGEVSDGWMSEEALWREKAYRVWAVRKMAGFVVTVFSLDGLHLEVMSKHALVGPHAQAARELLAKAGGAQRAQMAADLFTWGACASFECIRRTEDYQHPVLEEDMFDQQLVLIAVQKRAELREQSAAFTAMPAIASRWGVRCVPAVALQDGAALQEVLKAVEPWHSVYPPFTNCPVLAEGFVVLIEVNGKPEEEATPAASSSTFSWCYPIRLKLKTPRYIVLRAFRSLVIGDSRPPTYLYHHGLLGWLCPSHISVESLRGRLTKHGVWRLSGEFEASVQAKARVRHRNAVDTVGHALAQLQAISARSANPRSHCPLTVLVLCGLPGAGKTTISKALVQTLSTDVRGMPLLVEFVVHVSRDAVSRDVAQQHGIDDSSSKHKQRRLRAMVHDELCREMRDVVRFCQETQERGLLIFDACNATRASRQVWRRCFPASLDGYQVLHVDCIDAAVIAERAGHRDNHEVLRNAAEAQHALYTVRKKFQPPCAEELCWYVDTNAQSPTEAASGVQERLTELLKARRHIQSGAAQDDVSETAASPPRVLTVASARGELQQSHITLLRGLLDLPEGTAALLENAAACLEAGGNVNGRAAELHTLRVRLTSRSAEYLMQMVAQVLCAALAPALVVDESPANSLVVVGRRLLRHVTTTLWGAKASATATTSPVPITGTVVRGHLKWLRGWLLQGRESAALTGVTRALGERFEKAATTPHVTLLHGGAAELSLSDEELQAYLSSVGLQLGQEVMVRATTLLLDRHAVCFGVELSDGSTMQGSLSRGAEGIEGCPLHITVATASDTSAVYAGKMFASFSAWQSENEALMEKRRTSQLSVNRSKCKFHNFVEFQLDTAVMLRGVVELHTG